MDEVRYRLATPDDQAFLDDMNVAATFGARMPDADFPLTDDVFHDHPHIAEYSKDFGRPGDLGLIATDDRGPIGAVWAREYERTEDDAMLTHPFELTVAVRERARGQGIGRQLLDSFATMAWLQGRNEVNLGVHVKSPARKLYEAAGYSPILDGDGNEALVSGNYVAMTRRLDLVPVLRSETVWADGLSSLAKISLRGVNHTMVNHGSTTFYHVTSGEGAMVINGVVEHLKPGVIIEVPAGTPYYDEGNVDMKATSIPPFDARDVEILD